MPASLGFGLGLVSGGLGRILECCGSAAMMAFGEALA